MRLDDLRWDRSEQIRCNLNDEHLAVAAEHLLRGEPLLNPRHFIFFMKWGIKAARIKTDRLTHELPKDVGIKKMMPLGIQDDEIQAANALVSVILKG